MLFKNYIEVDCETWVEFLTEFRTYQTEVINDVYTDMQSKIMHNENPRNNGLVVAYVRYHKDGTKQYFITAAFTAEGNV